MNVKRIFGALLTVLGICGLIYAGVLFVGSTGSNKNIRELVIYGILGFLFFLAGINLVKATKDES